MSGEGWRDATVRHAEESLADAVRTADEIIADVVAERAPAVADLPEPEPEEPREPPTILRDAW